jgi:hypothetical protein
MDIYVGDRLGVQRGIGQKPPHFDDFARPRRAMVKREASACGSDGNTGG